MKVYLLELLSIPEHEITKYEHVLDEDRRKRIARYQRSADKRRSFGAGMILSYAWRKQFGERALPKIMRNESGKPCFFGEKMPFSLSHSGRYAACVLGTETDNALGLDIQEPRAVRGGAAERFCSAGEREQIRAGEDFCLIWSRKESLAKYLGSGLGGDPRLLDTAGQEAKAVSPDRDPEDGILEPRLLQTAEVVSPDRESEDDMMKPHLLQTAEAVSPNSQPENDAKLHLLQTAQGSAYLWSCITADGYAVSVCADKPLPCSLIFMNWGQIKKELF